MKKLCATFLALMLCSPFVGCTEQQQLENEIEDVQEQKEVLAETLEDAADDINAEVEQLKGEQQDVVEEKSDDVN